jgi:hypothetical protein
LTKGWKSGLSLTWIHVYSAFQGTINNATLSIDCGDCDGASVKFRIQGTNEHVGTATGGDNGGPGIFSCPTKWIQGGIFTTRIPQSAYSYLKQGNLVLEAYEDTGAGLWGSNRAILEIKYTPTANTDSTSATNVDSAPKETAAFTEGVTTTRNFLAHEGDECRTVLESNSDGGKVRLAVRSLCESGTDCSAVSKQGQNESVPLFPHDSFVSFSALVNFESF